MIELDIKIRAKDQDTIKLFTELMMKGLAAANQMGEVDVTLSAEKNGDTITLIRKEIIKRDPLDELKKQGFTLIETFIELSDLSVRSTNILRGFSNPISEVLVKPPFKYAEDITKERFMKCPGAGSKSWEEVEAELKLQKIKY